MTRHAAIATLTYDQLAQALGLPATVELRGIIGLPLGPRQVVQIVLVHDALPTAEEACWPVELTLEEILTRGADGA